MNPTDGTHAVAGLRIISYLAEALVTWGCCMLSHERLEYCFVIIATRSIIAPRHSWNSGIAGAR